MSDWIKTVDTDGVSGDYSSLAAALAAAPGPGNDIYITCYASGAHTNDTTQANPDGAGDYVKLIQGDEYYKLILSSTGGSLLIEDDYVDVVGLYVENTNTTGSASAAITIDNAAGISKIDSCELVGGKYTIRSQPNSGHVSHVFDTVARGGGIGIVASVANNTTINVYHSTLEGGATYGCYEFSGTLNAYADNVFNNGDDFANVTVVSNCASDDGDETEGGSAVTLDSSNDYENEFVDRAGHDYHLVSGSGCIGAGLDDPGSGLYSDDKDGVARTSIWDTGAYEYSSGGGTDIDATAGSLTIAGYDPSISIGTDINASLETISISGLNPSISIGTNIDAGLGTLNIASHNPSVSIGTDISVSPGQISIARYNPSISAGTDINAGKGSITIAGYNPDVDLSLNIDATLGTLQVAGYKPSVSAAVSIETSLGEIVVNGFNPSISVGTDIFADLGALTIAGYSADVSPVINIDMDLGAITISGFDANISEGINISVGIGSLLIAAYNSAILNQTLETPEERIFPIPEEIRVFSIPEELRIYSVEQENRIYSI